jgi:hypothetical protein
LRLLFGFSTFSSDEEVSLVEGTDFDRFLISFVSGISFSAFFYDFSSCTSSTTFFCSFFDSFFTFGVFTFSTTGGSLTSLSSTFFAGLPLFFGVSCVLDVGSAGAGSFSLGLLFY